MAAATAEALDALAPPSADEAATAAAETAAAHNDVAALREALDREGFRKVKIVASSGFNPAKCKLMAEAKAPIDW